jgi:hypothetical protein
MEEVISAKWETIVRSQRKSVWRSVQQIGVSTSSPR